MSKAAKGKLRGIRVEPAANGYAIHADHEPPAKGAMGMEHRLSPPHLATSRTAALAHMEQLMAAHEGAQPAGGDTPPADTPTQATPPTARGGLMAALRGGR